MEVGGLNQNADTADAGRGSGEVSEKMMTLLTLGSGGVGNSKSKNQRKIIEILIKLQGVHLNVSKVICL